MFAEGLEDHVDTIAERVTALGGVATGTARDAAEGSRLPEFPEGPIEGVASVVALADRFAALAKTTGAAIVTADDAGDLGTADLFTGIVRDLDKWLYFLEGHLTK
jgi:starvation-inducible DNA-binding protein